MNAAYRFMVLRRRTANHWDVFLGGDVPILKIRGGPGRFVVRSDEGTIGRFSTIPAAMAFVAEQLMTEPPERMN